GMMERNPLYQNPIDAFKGNNKAISRRAKRIVEGCTAEYGKRYKNPESLLDELVYQSHIHFSAFAYLPGFRSRSPWKMALASFAYLYYAGMAACLLLFLELDREAIFLISLFPAEILVFFDVFRLERLSPAYMRAKQRFPFLKWIVKVFLAAIVFVFFSIFGFHNG
ncbi:MAG: hypothetical protein IJU50_02530, partial [Lachnospiraceae bacterium]|nr:hypothetical protein [Lachnospiraceae bacterium]